MLYIMDDNQIEDYFFYVGKSIAILGNIFKSNFLKKSLSKKGGRVGGSPPSYDTITKVNINILEAVIKELVDYYKLKNQSSLINSLEGILLIISIKYIKKYGKVVLLKLWILLYYYWNITFCKNQKYLDIPSIAHNLPCLISIFSSSNFDDCFNKWAMIRGSSLAITICNLLIINGLNFKNIKLNNKKLIILNILNSIFCYRIFKDKDMIQGIIGTTIINGIF